MGKEDIRVCEDPMNSSSLCFISKNQDCFPFLEINKKNWFEFGESSSDGYSLTILKLDSRFSSSLFSSLLKSFLENLVIQVDSRGLKKLQIVSSISKGS